MTNILSIIDQMKQQIALLERKVEYLTVTLEKQLETIKTLMEVVREIKEA